MIKDDTPEEPEHASAFATSMKQVTSTGEHWSRCAIASLVLAVIGFATLGLFVGLFLAAAGAVCGHVARHYTGPGKMRGRGLATTGVAIGYLAMFSFPVLVLVVSASFPAFDFWKEEQLASRREASQAQASRLFLACESYARSNAGRYPTDWQQLSGRYLSPKDLRDSLRSPYPGGKVEAFEIVPHERPVLDAIADTVIVIQEIAPPSEPQIAVVYADGTVKSIHNPDST